MARQGHAQREDPASVFSLYRRLNWLRKSSPALRRGSYRTVRAPPGVFAFAREADAERVLVALNFTKNTQQVALETGSGRVLLSTDHERDGRGTDLQRVELRPDEALLLNAR